VTSRKQIARRAGALYLAMSLSAINLVYFPAAFLVRGDAAATAARIEAAPRLYRLLVLVDLAAGVAAIFLAMTLYQLFQEVDRRQARLLVAMLLVQVPIMFLVTLLQMAPRVVLSGSGYWSVFEKPQRDALALGLLNLRTQAIGGLSIYWGLWLLPLGILTYRSAFLPRLLGVFLIAAACAYVISAVTFFIFPAAYGTAFNLGIPLYALGELGFVNWLLIKGAREEVAA
jgi:hypothetical protein